MNGMEKAKNMIDDIVNGLPEYCVGDELKTFTYVYVKVATMLIYDEEASNLVEAKLGGYDRQMAQDTIINPASDIRCLERGKALCTGFSEVLNTILNKLNIKTIIVKAKEDHAWNQVCINGKWYNCDLTNDYSDILDGLNCLHFLKSNKEDTNFIKRFPTSEYNECKESISDELQEQLIKQALLYIRNIEKKEDMIQKQHEVQKKGLISKIINKTKGHSIKK